MKHNQVFLRHIFDEIIFLVKETEGIKFEEFIKNEILKRACSRSLEIIGEAAKNLSLDFKKQHKDIEWKKISGLRDKMIHGYFGVNWDIVWDVMRSQIPKLKVQVENILDKAESENT
jgi:uncharacterized protein with HEPN domain